MKAVAVVLLASLTLIALQALLRFHEFGCWEDWLLPAC